jgi:hypothetical protein
LWALNEKGTQEVLTLPVCLLRIFT